jgi:MoaA/NifB/PqqE/SkfB family radical SAM enzyme
MCDIWKSNQNKKEISAETLEKHVTAFGKLNVREVVLSGGEALMHSNLWKLCALLKEHKICITLLSTGLLLKKHAEEIVDYIDQVIVSVDGSEQVHDQIRNIPQGFAKMTEGIRELKKRKANFSITGRCVLQRGNFFDFINIVKAAKDIGLNQISFLGADVSSDAFNRPGGWPDERVNQVALTESETIEFEKIVQRSFIALAREYKTNFVAESREKMMRIVQYYKAVNNMAAYPETVCNAPWVSAVIESDGNVLPCFFHKAYGNIYENNFSDIINSKQAVEFRRNLNIAVDDICKKCVCSLKLRPYQMP